jgi:Sulfatase/TonB dependent receptor
LKSEIETRRNTQMLFNWGLEFQPIQNLYLKSKLSYNNSQGRSRNFVPMNLVTDLASFTPKFPNPDSGKTVLSNTSLNNFIIDNIANYRFKLAKSNFDITAGYLVQESTTENSNMTGVKLLDENFILPDSKNVKTAPNAVNFTGGEDFIRFRVVSMISRLNYSFDNRYVVNLSYRRDGNSRFGRNVKWGNFPAGSFTWRASEEGFFKNVKWLSDLRFEFGYGITGNANGAGEYGHLGNIKQVNYPFGGISTLGNTVGALPNQSVTWEEAEQWDAGVNVGFFKDRLKIAFNVYEQKTGNPLAQIPVSQATGFGNVVGNQEGLIRNRGFEVDINATPYMSKSLRWTVNLNVSRYSNILVDYYLPQGLLLGNAGNNTQITITAPGQPIGMYRGLRILGLFTPEDIANPAVPKYPGAAVGDMKFFDGNGDGLEGLPKTFFYPFFHGKPYPNLLNDTKEGDYLDDALTNKAMQFIMQKKDSTFFMELNFYAPHVPIEGKPSLVEKYKNKRTKTGYKGLPEDEYAAMVENIDYNVGRLIKHLKASNLDKKTIVIFTSDNGGLHVQEVPAFAKHTPPTKSDPMKGGKGYVYEGGIKTPWIIWMPAMIKKGREDASIVTTDDIFNTCMNLALVDKKSPDGMSLMPIIKGESFKNRPYFLHFPHYSPQHGLPAAVMRQGDFKLIEWYETGDIELFNLSKDEGESTNIAASNAALVTEMKTALAAWRKDMGAKMTTLNPNYVKD